MTGRDDEDEGVGENDETETDRGTDDPGVPSDQLFPESEPVDDPTAVPDPEPTEDPMDSFGRPPDGEAPSNSVDDDSAGETGPGDFGADRSATDPGPDDADREPNADGLDSGTSLGDVEVQEDAGFDGDSGTDGPLGDLADRVRDRRDQPVDDSGDLFEEADVAEVDEETLWKQVESDEGFVVEEPIDREDVVEKSAYCEKCEFFTGPPRVRCTHEGTTIVEMTDLDRFRVRNCPVVLEEEALENIND